MQALFDLIKSLTPREKAYLKQHVFKRKSNHSKLFETINQLVKKKQEKGSLNVDFDVAIKKKHHKDVFFKQIGVAKNKLYNQLLKGLRLYYSNQTDRNSAIVLGELLDFVHILHQKGVYVAMDKEIKRVKNLAYEQEAFPVLLQLLFFEKRYIIEQKGKKLIDQITKLNQEENDILDQLKEETTYHQLQFQAEALLKTKHFENNATQQEGIQTLLAHPQLQNEVNPNTFRSKLCFHNIKALIALRTKEKEAIFAHYAAILQLWQARPNAISENRATYRQALCNYLHGCYYTQRFEEYPDILAQIKALPSPSIVLESKIFQMVAYHQTLWYLDGGQLEKASEELPELERQLESFRPLINPARFLALCSNMMLIYFYLEDFTNSHKWSNEIAIYPKLDVRKSVRKLNLLFQLILQMELGNTDLIPNLIRNVKRQLQKTGELLEVDQLVLKNMHKLSSLNTFDETGIQLQLQLFQTALQELDANNLVPIISMQIFNNYSLWLMYRLQGGKLRDLLLEHT